MSCAKCPCPATCLHWPAFCEWAAEDPPDEIKLRHICARSGMPSVATMAGNVAKAVGRVIVAAATGGSIQVPPPVYHERLTICRGCEFNADAPIGVRCMKCGCGGIKLELATEACPIDKWPRWDAK